MIIRKTPVTLTVEETERLLRVMTDVARADWEHSRKSKSAVVRQFSQERANWLRDMESKIVSRLYVHSAESCPLVNA